LARDEAASDALVPGHGRLKANPVSAPGNQAGSGCIERCRRRWPTLHPQRIAGTLRVRSPRLRWAGMSRNPNKTAAEAFGKPDIDVRVFFKTLI
jgi:hypothetical protein